MSSDSEKDDARSLDEDGESNRDMMGIFSQRDLRPSSQEPILMATTGSHETGYLDHPMA